MQLLLIWNDTLAGMGKPLVESGKAVVSLKKETRDAPDQKSII